MKEGLNILFVCLSLIVTSCKSKHEEYKTLEGNAQGTTFRITYADKSEDDFSLKVDSIFRVIDKSMSLWDSTSLISNINNNLPYDNIDLHFKKVFLAAQKVSGETEGYFDMTVAPLVKAWGFSTKKGLPAPSQAKIDSLKSNIGYNKVSFFNSKIVKEKPEIQIDFNALAQGYTVDVMCNFLEEKGVNNYLVEIGGEVRARGVNKEGKVWRVGIEKPKQERDIEVVINLDGKSLATSGSYRKFFEKDGKKFSHAIDPHLGLPVSHNLLSISVIAEDCMTADAYATAYLVMGLEKAKLSARKNKLDFFAIYDDNGTIKTFHTEGLDTMIAKD